MNNFQRGDIVRYRINLWSDWEYFHVEHAHSNGGLDVISDADGRPYGLSVNTPRIEKTTLAAMLADKGIPLPTEDEK